MTPVLFLHQEVEHSTSQNFLYHNRKMLNCQHLIGKYDLKCNSSGVKMLNELLNELFNET